MGDDALHALVDELRLLAGWLRLDGVELGERGDLVLPLRHALREAG
jgi:hypothetical protein